MGAGSAPQRLLHSLSLSLSLSLCLFRVRAPIGPRPACLPVTLCHPLPLSFLESLPALQLLLGPPSFSFSLSFSLAVSKNFFCPPLIASISIPLCSCYRYISQFTFRTSLTFSASLTLLPLDVSPFFFPKGPLICPLGPL